MFPGLSSGILPELECFLTSFMWGLHNAETLVAALGEKGSPDAPFQLFPLFALNQRSFTI